MWYSKSLQVAILFSAYLLSPLSQSETFSTDFESVNATTAQTINISNNGLSITLTGGTAFRIGNGSLYHSGIKSWMLDPAGTTSRGTSTGSGIISLSEDAQSISFYIRTMNASSGAQVIITDSLGAVLLDNSSIGNADWSHIMHSVIDGDALIHQVEVSATGSDMLAIDDFSYTTATTDMDDMAGNSGDSDSMSSSSGSLQILFLVFLISVLIKSNKQ